MKAACCSFWSIRPILPLVSCSGHHRSVRAGGRDASSPGGGSGATSRAPAWPSRSTRRGASVPNHGLIRVATDVDTRAAAINLGRLAVLDIRFNGTAWEMAMDRPSSAARWHRPMRRSRSPPRPRASDPQRPPHILWPVQPKAYPMHAFDLSSGASASCSRRRAPSGAYRAGSHRMSPAMPVVCRIDGRRGEGRGRRHGRERPPARANATHTACPRAPRPRTARAVRRRRRDRGVKKHLTHIFDKLGAANRTEATVRARTFGLLT
jgi:hypothetical protein